MPAEELSFRIGFDGPLTEFTRAFPHVSLSLWCDWKKEVVEVAGAGERELTQLRESLAAVSPSLEMYPLDDRTHVIVADCVDLPHDFVNHAVDEAHCLNMAPTRFEDGHEIYNVVSFHEDRSRDLFRALRDGGRAVELLTKRPLKVQPLLNTRGLGVSSLLDGLTDRQIDAVLLGYRHGLYGSPRRTTAAAIASSVGLSRSTFEEHLRKAENRMIANLVPYLELHAKARRAAKPPEARP